MATDYRLDIYNTSGERVAVVTDFLALSYNRRVNYPGILRVTLNGDSSVVTLLENYGEVEVWRKPTGATWYRDFVGSYRYGQWTYGEEGKKFTVMCPGLLDKFSSRIVAWYAGTEGKSVFTASPAETIMKELVKYNATTNAVVANGRLEDGLYTGMSIQTDGADGETLDWFCAYDNLLETLQELALIGGGDFDLVKIANTGTRWEFRWYTDQLGTDRTALVKFALGLGNMGEPVYFENHISERTVALVGGQGEADQRNVVSVEGANYNRNTNLLELFVNGSDIATDAGLIDRGAWVLKDKTFTRDFRFKVIQIPSSAYGVHYFLGDKVTAINPFTGASYTQKIDEVTITLQSNGYEDIDVRLSLPL